MRIWPTKICVNISIKCVYPLVPNKTNRTIEAHGSLWIPSNWKTPNSIPKLQKLSTEQKMELLQIGIFRDELVAFTATGALGQVGGPLNIALRSVFSFHS